MFTVRKLDHAGQQVTAYPAEMLRRESRAVVLRAVWTRPRADLGFVAFEPGDLFTEYFYADRWYNIFRVCAADGRLKGWYCNVTRPARIGAAEVSAEDLALDLWVSAEGEARVLDEEEFAALPLSAWEREAAQRALEELRALAARREGPFALVRRR